ncbi:ABC transporter permease [Brachybacterium squillarum]|uniref:ABC transporter permease n=1 Tax=Brachybacterium squillarum TaxID=661979 RepID=UPI0022233623|nr:ABC transporter permease [Brachybacterium squillarum]MCW1805153.1 ABC transporter permease [Brachybacterium squillarum]
MASEVKSTSDVKRALEAKGLDPSGLSRIGSRPSLVEYIQQLWQRRHFIWYDARHRASTQHSRMRLGNVWLVLRPLVDVSFYYVIFGLVLGAGGDMENFAAFLLIGILLFRSTSTSIGGGAGVLRANKSMIKAFTFPRASIPIAAVLQASMTAVFTMVVMCFAIIVLPPHEVPAWTWPLIVPIFLIQAVLNLGLMFITARIGFHLPDMANILGVFSRFLMYGSGVMFPITQFVHDPTVLTLVELNPLFQIIGMMRTVLIDGQVPEARSWLIVGCWAVGVLVAGFVFFWRAEESYGRELG